MKNFVNDYSTIQPTQISQNFHFDLFKEKKICETSDDIRICDFYMLT